MTTDSRWLLDWHDRSRDPARRVQISAATVAEARAAVERLLAGATWTPPAADGVNGPGTVPASEAFRAAVLDLSDDACLLGLWSGVRFECDDRVLELVRER